MVKSLKATKKKTGQSEASSMAALKKAYKAKLSELSKQFDKQLQAAKKAEKAKAILEVHEAFVKHAKVKDKALKDALRQVDKAQATKVKLIAKKPTKIVKKTKLEKTVSKKSPIKKKKTK